MSNEEHIQNDSLIKVILKLLTIITVLITSVIIVLIFAVFQPNILSWFKKSDATIANELAKKQSFEKWEASNKLNKEMNSFWVAADMNQVNGDSNYKKQLAYGKALIAHTATYLGPKGSVMHSTNGMNCQNCHLDAGTKAWGNNYGAVFSSYPKYRARSGQEEDIYKRINDCMERSLNGKALAVESKEMQAMKAYIEYLGKNVQKGEKPKGVGIYELAFMDRPADPVKGNALYMAKCQSCHQANGEGLLAADQTEYTYPPLWGQHSYNQGAGLFRLSRFAGYIKYNMPQGVSFPNSQLTDEEAWDIAAFVNSQPRPSKDLRNDWPKIAEKPIDHPFGLYADTFTENQHKYGPFKPIADAKKKQQANNEKKSI